MFQIFSPSHLQWPQTVDKCYYHTYSRHLDSCLDFLSLNSYPINHWHPLILWPKYLSHLSTSSHPHYYQSYQHRLTSIWTIVTASCRAHYIQFFYTSVPHSGRHIPKERQNGSLEYGRKRIKLFFTLICLHKTSMKNYILLIFNT